MRPWSRRRLLQTGLGAAGASVISPLVRAAAPPRERLLLDSGWRFHLGHAHDSARDFGFGANDAFAKTGRVFGPVARASFKDEGWQPVSLPHDWAVTLPFENARRLAGRGSKPLGREYPATSIGWYRRVFELPAADAGRRLTVEFDGVFRDAMVAFNGNYLGRNLSGYLPFRHDITDLANPGGKNVLVVRVDATQSEGWFYEGAGIYRHVWLTKTSPLHVGHWGTFVTAEVGKGAAALTVATELENEADGEAHCRVVYTVLDRSGATVASGRSQPTTVAARGRARVVQKLSVRRPALWSIEEPHLYTLVTTVDGDRTATPFGIRTCAFDPERGFFLNGRHLVLKGTCNHQDHAGVGSALPDRLHQYRVEKLKEMGSNAYRTAHNPPAPELLDACDRLGMLVIDETRLFSPEAEGTSQLERMIRRDRNHPSIFSWCIANEEWEEQGTDRGTRMAATLTRLAHELDPSRPVTAGMDGAWGKGIALGVDVQGFNYHLPDLDAFHARFPRRPSMGTEVASTYATRGAYANDKARGQMSAYDVNKPRHGTSAEEWWKAYSARPWIAGGFVWTGFDYRGEPSPYEWPSISSQFGVLDTCGFPKDDFYYYQAWWTDRPVLHLFPHWNWAGQEGKPIEVWCHSNLDQVELFLNGKRIGSQEVPRNGHLTWQVPYEPGRLEARGSRGGQQVLVSARDTTGPATRLILRPDRPQLSANGEDVGMIAVFVVDAQERVVPTADNPVSFRVSGSGALIGVGNGDPSSHEPDKGTSRRAFHGACAAIVQASQAAGELRIEATSPRLEPATAILPCLAAPVRPQA